MQPDGKSVIGGAFTTVNTVGRVRVARLNSDGSVDTSFNPRVGPDSSVFDLSLQYVGYLRRNPDSQPDANFDGYNFWLAKLKQFNGNFTQAEMVKSFIISGEYQNRFGP